jgi:hypothetical protein
VSVIEQTGRPSLGKVQSAVWSKAALFEADKTKLSERIAQAEKALALKARELFYVAGDSIEEGTALDDAVYALRALRTTSQTNLCMPPVVVVAVVRDVPQLTLEETPDKKAASGRVRL